MSITDRARLCVVLVVGAGLLVAACGGGSSTDACGLSNSAAATNAAAPATAAASGSWSYANADLDNTRDARGSTISSANLSGLAQAWTFKLTGRAAAGLRPYGSLAANPIVQDGVVYFQDLDSNVYALALATGKLRWYYQGVPDDFKDYDMQTSPISANINGVSVVIGSGKMGYVYEMNAETGQLIWKTPVGEHNGHDDDSLHALEHTSTLKAPLTILPGSLGGVLTNLALAGGTLYAVTCDLPLTYTSLNEPTPTKAAGPATGEVAALNLATGKVEWDTKVPQLPLGAATVSNDLVFTTLYKGVLIALDRRTGAIVYRHQLPTSTNAAIAIAGNTVIVPAGGVTTSTGGGDPQVVAFTAGR